MKLTSFNDFSVGILQKAYGLSEDQSPDLRKILQVVEDEESKAACVKVWKDKLFKGTEKRSIIKALTSNGLVEPKSWKLTSEGKAILNTKSADDAVKAFAKQLMMNCNSQVIIDGVRSRRSSRKDSASRGT